MFTGDNIQASDADEERKHTHEIEQQVQKISMALYAQREGESEEETLSRAMRDPEVASIMQDPVIQQVNFQSMPNSFAPRRQELRILIRDLRFCNKHNRIPKPCRIT